jgi:hypothetical protein
VLGYGGAVYDATARTTAELLGDWAAIMRALRKRDVIRTNNNPVGDIAEALVHAHYGGERASFVQAGWDVRAPDGERIQVKAVRNTATNKRTNLSPIRDSDYDSVVVVIFDEDFQVTEGLKFPRELVEEMFAPTAHVNGRIVRLSQAIRADPRVEIVDLSDAYVRLHA